ncbi:MAG: hypothetical protein ACRDQA_19215, partial [Nocardioidaceae bacterium]
SRPHPVGAELLPGCYRIPSQAQPLLRAALLAYDAHPHALCLFTVPGHSLLGTQSLAHLIRRGATLAEVPVPPAARPLYRLNPSRLFAEDATSEATITALTRQHLPTGPPVH